MGWRSIEFLCVNALLNSKLRVNYAIQAAYLVAIRFESEIKTEEMFSNSNTLFKTGI